MARFEDDGSARWQRGLSRWPSRWLGPGSAVLLSLGVAGCGDDSDAGNGSPDSGTPSAGCTRESLKAVVDDYFAALAAHDPSRLAFSSSLKFTENGALRELGKGLWETAGALQFRRDLLDTERCGTLSQAVINEGEGPIIVGVRLALAEQKITEVESYVARSGQFAFNPAGVLATANHDWQGILPAEQRSTREQLNAVADSYFSMLQDRVTVVAFDVPCDRWENGTKTTSGECTHGMPPGPVQITGRRYPVADVDSGIAAGFVLFAGTLLDFHLFKVKGGKVQLIQAVIGPAASTSGW
jgi:hypothetical protein